MIRFEHANLVVKDIATTLHFLQTAFPQWQVRGSGRMNWRGTPRRWLHVGDENTYITLNDQAVGENRDLNGLTPGLAHLGFEVDDLQATRARLEKAGYVVDIEGSPHPHRQNCYFVEPGGFQFEFTQYFSNDPAERNNYADTETIPVNTQGGVEA